LEVGVGAGTDHLSFVRAGASCHGVDLTAAAIETTRRRLELAGLTSDLRVSDAEALPFADESFDLVYSWGVIHHTPDTRRAASEIIRVLKPGGRFCVMVYNRQSLLALQAWVRFGLARGNPLASRAALIAENIESPGTRAFSRGEASALFQEAHMVRVSTVVTAYDMRVGRRTFLPQWTWRFVPPRLGWFHVIEGRR
jgi:ubiquinone/menaquinone biosynthesis C-methylase UbiE